MRQAPVAERLFYQRMCQFGTSSHAPKDDSGPVSRKALTGARRRAIRAQSPVARSMSTSHAALSGGRRVPGARPSSRRRGGQRRGCRSPGRVCCRRIAAGRAARRGRALSRIRAGARGARACLVVAAARACRLPWIACGAGRVTIVRYGAGRGGPA